MYMNRNNETLKKNQKAPETTGRLRLARPPASLIARIAPAAAPMPPPAIIGGSPRPVLWPKSHPAKPPSVSGSRISQPFSSHHSDSTLGSGRSQPPKNSMVAMHDTTIMFVYSARKKNANFIPEYSVWK